MARDGHPPRFACVFELAMTAVCHGQEPAGAYGSEQRAEKLVAQRAETGYSLLRKVAKGFCLNIFHPSGSDFQGMGYCLIPTC